MKTSETKPMTAKHTPTPWQASKGVNKTVGQFIWRNNGDEANTSYVRICRNVATEADAAFIVEACNSHEALTAQRDQLLEACKSLALIGEMIGSDWASFVAEVSLPEKERLNRNQFYSRELEKHLNGLGDAVDQAQAAIQAAEGER